MTDLMDKIVALAKRRGFVWPGSEIYGGLAGFYDYGPYGLAFKHNLKRSWWRHFVSGRAEMLGLDATVLGPAKIFEASGHLASFGEEMFQAGEVYLRPETAQSIFSQFKNFLDCFHPNLPFGVAQIGRAFRNETSPREWLFRLREFEQMEIEYFVRAGEWEKHFERWRVAIGEWLTTIGLPADKIHELEVPDGERAHYSRRTIDFEFDYPFGRRELCGLAYRGDYDLGQHQQFSGQDLTYLDEESKERFLPHVIEPSFGLDRLVLAVLASAYHEDDPPAGGGDEKRVVLKLAPAVAPIKVAIFPLLKNKPELVAKARALYSNLKPLISNIQFDDNGNIGKRYRRQDEIGTPWCVTIDFQTLEDDTVTLRTRDTGEQIRVPIKDLVSSHILPY